MTPSLAVRTDLALLAGQGAEVTVDADRRVVRMAANPDFRWGNFVLVPEAGDPATRIRQHAAAFPAADFTTVGVDDAHPVLDEGAWRSAGFSIDRLAVLVADGVATVPEASVRPLSDADWAAETAVSVSLEADLDGRVDPVQAEFSARRTRGQRDLTERSGPAIGLYRRLGFREVETQLQLTRLGESVDGTAYPS